MLKQFLDIFGLHEGLYQMTRLQPHMMYIYIILIQGEYISISI